MLYKILKNSKFTLHTNKKGQKPFIIYDEIKIIEDEKETENKTIEEIRNAFSFNDRLSNNYKQFLSFLNKFESLLSNKFYNNYKLNMTLKFENVNGNSENFIIPCLYEVTDQIKIFKFLKMIIFF